MSALIQNTVEWEEMRKTKIGASDAPIIMMESPWNTPYGLWEQKMGLRKGFTSARMRRGSEMEETARQHFEMMSGHVMFPQVVIHPGRDWMMASLDGMDMEAKHIVEIKCPGKADHDLALNGRVPQKYVPQIQHQLECTGLEMAYYFSFDGVDGVIIEVWRDDNYIKQMLSAESKFYDCMLEFVPPALCDRDFNVRDDNIWKIAADEYRAVKSQISELEVRENELRESLLCMAGGANTMGGGVKLTKVVRKGSVNYASIPELANVPLDKYRKDPVESWRINFS